MKNTFFSSKMRKSSFYIKKNLERIRLTLWKTPPWERFWKLVGWNGGDYCYCFVFGCFVIVIGGIVVSVIDCYWLSVGRLVLFWLVGKDVFVSCKAGLIFSSFCPVVILNV